MSDLALSSSTGEFKNYTQMAFLHGYSEVEKDPLLMNLTNDVRERMNSDILCPICRIPGRIRRGNQQGMGSRQPAFCFEAEAHLEHCFMTDLLTRDGVVRGSTRYSMSSSNNVIFNSLAGHFISSCKSEGLLLHKDIVDYSSWVAESLIKAKKEVPSSMLSGKWLSSRMRKEAKKGFTYDTADLLNELQLSLVLLKDMMPFFFGILEHRRGVIKEKKKLKFIHYILEKYDVSAALIHLNKQEYDTVLKNFLPVACFIGYLSNWNDADANIILTSAKDAFQIKYSDEDESVTIPTPFDHICRRDELLRALN